MKYKNKSVLIVSVILSFLLLFFIYERSFSRYAIIGKKNVRNATKLKPGIDKNRVLKIMGQPQKISYLPTNDNSCIIFYTSNDVDFQEIQIKIDKNNLVSEVVIPK